MRFMKWLICNLIRSRRSDIYENLTPMDNHSAIYTDGRLTLPGDILVDRGTLICNVNIISILY